MLSDAKKALTPYELEIFIEYWRYFWTNLREFESNIKIKVYFRNKNVKKFLHVYVYVPTIWRTKIINSS